VGYREGYGASTFFSVVAVVTDITVVERALEDDGVVPSKWGGCFSAEKGFWCGIFDGLVAWFFSCLVLVFRGASTSLSSAFKPLAPCVC
jgi:hypothetical protein